jgi:hypothetical protein
MKERGNIESTEREYKEEGNNNGPCTVEVVHYYVYNTPNNSSVFHYVM